MEQQLKIVEQQMIMKIFCISKGFRQSLWDSYPELQNNGKIIL
jgi:hypothetical protein